MPANTRPMKLKLDFSALYEETAPRWSACFKAGEWFRRGLPEQQTPPEDGIPTCVRGANEWETAEQGCWGACVEADVITPALRAAIMHIVTAISAEFTNFFSVIPNDGPLRFDVSEGRYRKVYREKGYDPEPACALDCNFLGGVQAADYYCTEGVDADSVLSVTRPPLMQGVAGSGTSCATNRDGRPNWLVFSWLASATDLGQDLDLAVTKYRHLVTHETIHALGFSNWGFSRATDSRGLPKGLIKLERVKDKDGREDDVYHFKRGRAYELGKQYFDCQDDDQWLGVPLMGEPEMGRASHWDTRTMRDDVMSYGDRPYVSSLTLAAMEDTGHYLANYSAAHCMRWGRKQGCNFVVTRCSEGYDDSSAPADDEEEDCRGDDYWESHPMSILERHCDGGSDPCSDVIKNGWVRTAGGRSFCNAQCNVKFIDSNCSAGPEDPVDASKSGDLGKGLANYWYQWLWLLVWVLAIFFVFGWARMACCPARGSTTIAGWLSFVVWAFGAALLGFSVWGLFFTDAFNPFLGFAGMWVLFSLGLMLIIIASLTCIGICCKSRLTLTVVAFVLSILLVGQVVLTILILYWSYSMQMVSEESLATLEGTDKQGRWDGAFGEDVLKHVESFMCNTYTLCCKDTNLGDDGTCIAQHAGITTDVGVTLVDPSQPSFCPYVSGVSTNLRPSQGTCKLLHWLIPDFELEECRDAFCPTGVEGYSLFVDDTLTWMRSNAMYIGGVIAFFVLFQLILLVNVWNLRKADPSAPSAPPPRKNVQGKGAARTAEV